MHGRQGEAGGRGQVGFRQLWRFLVWGFEFSFGFRAGEGWGGKGLGRGMLGVGFLVRG